MTAEREKKRERLPVSVSAAVFIEDNDRKLLFLQQAEERKGFKWGPPAGGMEAFESPQEAAIRETREETGLEVELIDLIGVYCLPRGSSGSGVAFVFRGKIKGGELKLKEGEIKNSNYFTSNQLLTMLEKGEIYKPEYNEQSIKDWAIGKSYPIEILFKIKKSR